MVIHRKKRKWDDAAVEENIGEETKKPAIVLSEAAKEAAARINALLAVKGLEKTSTTQMTAPLSLSSPPPPPPSEFVKEIEINDSSHRFFLTRASTQTQVS
jgi:hypothetical protein